MIKNYIETAAKFICAAFIGAAVYIFIRYLLPPLMPFILAFVLVALADIPSAKLAKRTKIKAKVYRLLFSVILVLAVFVIMYLLLNKLVFEVSELTSHLQDGGLERILLAIDEKLVSIGEKYPFLASISEESTGACAKMIELIEEAMAGVSTYLGQQASLLAGKMIISLPGTVLFIVIFIVALLFLALDFNGLKEKVRSLIPEKWRLKAARFKNSVLSSMVGYIKAYSLIMLVMFSVLFIGLTLIRSRYALTLAFITALLDMMPIIGVGIVLLPWAVALFLQGSAGMGLGVLGVYAACVITRQIIEPKIVGKNIGLPPVLTLICMYVGLKLFGAIGLIVFPFSAAVIFSSLKAKEGMDKKAKK